METLPKTYPNHWQDDGVVHCIVQRAGDHLGHSEQEEELHLIVRGLRHLLCQR